MAEPGTFVLATTNPNKAREIREIFASCDLGIELVDRPASVGEVEETEETLLGNARLKARALVGLPAIAEDTGMEVEALAGAPGVRSARYAGEPSDDEANVDKVLSELKPRVGPDQRRARFVTVAVAMWPDGRETIAEGSVEGWIAGERRGRGGFGYDPSSPTAAPSGNWRRSPPTPRTRSPTGAAPFAPLPTGWPRARR